MAHRIDQRLIAVTQIDGTPDRRLLDALARPGTVLEVDQRVWLILYRGVGHALLACGNGSIDAGLFVHCLLSGGPRTQWHGTSLIFNVYGNYSDKELEPETGGTTAGRSFSEPGDRR